MSRLHAIGGTTFDLIATGLERLPANVEGADEFTPSSLAFVPAPFTPTVGGNAGNLAYVAARLGGDVGLVTPLGDDLFGDWLRERLGEVGVVIDPVGPPESSLNVIANDVEGRRLALFHPVRPTAAGLKAVAATRTIRPDDTVALMGYPHPEPEALRAWAEAGAAGACVMLDIGPATAALTEDELGEVLPGVDLLLSNEAELGVLVGGPDDEVAAAARLAADYDMAVIVKRGPRGATWVDARGALDVPAFDVPPGPTVGAGDAHAAGLLHALACAPPRAEAREAGIRRALRFGAATAALVIGSGRGVLGAPTAAEVRAFLAERGHHDDAALADAAGDPATDRPAAGDPATDRPAADAAAAQDPPSDPPASHDQGAPHG